jgi:hypothetical protein
MLFLYINFVIDFTVLDRYHENFVLNFYIKFFKNLRNRYLIFILKIKCYIFIVTSNI